MFMQQDGLLMENQYLLQLMIMLLVQMEQLIMLQNIMMNSGYLY